MKTNKIWTIPYIDQSKEFWERLDNNYGAYIDEVYLPIPINNIASGRPLQPSQHVDKFLKESLFVKAFLINPIILKRPVEKISSSIIDSLKKYYEKYHIQSVTVTNLALAQEIKRKLPQIKLHASVLMDIFEPSQLVYLNDVFDVLVPSSRINRNLDALKCLKDGFKGEIKLIVNEGCLPNCVYRTQHFYEMGSEIEYPKSLCQQIIEKKPWLRLTGSWVLPQHIHFYDGLYDKLKLSGRVTLQNPEHYFNVFGAYIAKQPRRPHKIGAGPVCGNLNMHIEDEFFKTLLSCSKNCIECSICKEHYEME